MDNSHSNPNELDILARQFKHSPGPNYGKDYVLKIDRGSVAALERGA